MGREPVAQSKCGIDICSVMEVFSPVGEQVIMRHRPMGKLGLYGRRTVAPMAG